MINQEQRNHDLAVVAAAVSAYRNFDSEVCGDNPTEKRASFADYLQDEYEHFLKFFTEKTK